MADTAPVALPPLPISKTPVPWRVGRIVLLGLIQALGLVLVVLVFDGVEASFSAAVGVVIVLALLNAFVWPLAIRLTLPLIVLTVGLFTFFLNALFVAVAVYIVEGFEISSLWLALLIALWLSALTVAFGSLLRVDDHVWRREAVRRIVKRREPPERTDVPGIVFIQIDGLGHDVLAEAIETGHAPVIGRLVEGGSHRLIEWECDLSSQTGAMQAGIMFGDNTNMPAFRWFEKETGRVMVSNKPSDASEIEQRQSTGVGLLSNGGVSRANVFSGDASDSMFTFSTVLTAGQTRSRFIYAVATPFALLRLIVLMIVDVGRELRDARRAVRADVEPRMHRGGVYPLLRAATAVVLADLTWSLLISDTERGVPSAYIDLVGYDEVAHHSGIQAREALDTLHRLDTDLGRFLSSIGDAPRPYYIVVLSDHGQTQGSTFRQRYDQTLDELVRSLARASVAAPVLAEEGWNNLNGLLTDAAADESTLGRVVERTTRSRSVDGEVLLGPETEAVITDDEIVVLASGNLGLLTFTRIEGRASRQAIDQLYPGLVDGLRNHDGVGLVMVRDEVDGDVVLGSAGTHYLDRGSVDGVDPLAPFGPNAAKHLKRTSTFANCPDILVNSFYDPEADEGAAFEELIGFHGGLGGKQCRPFVLAPSTLDQPIGALVGARSIHQTFTGWLEKVQGRSTV